MLKNTAALLAFTLTLMPALPVMAADPSPAPATADAAAEKPVTTQSGLQYVDTKVGSGPMPKKGQMVAITYTISTNGKRLESSRAGAKMRFVLGKDQALKGIEEGVSTMKVGGQRKLTLPPSLGYGAAGAGKVPPNATLEVDVELHEIQ
jgi:peptidylprolyl isomerase